MKISPLRSTYYRRKYAAPLLMALSTYLTSMPAFAAPFDSCPTRAFLSQNTNAHLYDVNLVTGHYTLLSREMGAERINALGFSVHDRYFYAWSYEHERLARIGDDYQIIPLEMNNISNANFFVGDVAVDETAHYVYRRGAQYGLYRVELDPQATDYLDMTRVVDGSALDLNIFDMAFHPTDGFAYAVDRTGMLWRIDVNSGTANSIASMGEQGTFGAAYFDVEGRLYFSRNSDGYIFRVDIDSQDLQPQLFAYGPSSSTNDGARCVLAALVDESDDNVDYGDAPDSYQTSLDNNGPRHEVVDPPVLYLGSGVDGESDASIYPLSDGQSEIALEDDGISFPTGVRADASSVLLVRASDTGYLNGWIDLDQSGTFDSSDQVITDRQVNEGSNFVGISLPDSSELGSTWSRFRLSSQPGLQHFGGAPDGEVEDQQLNITEANESVTWYPGESTWSTIAFEDNWPREGDYDMNDLVVRMRTAVFENSEGISSVWVQGEIAAVGAAYGNGFAIRLPGISRSEVDTTQSALEINSVNIDTPILDTLTDDAIFIIAENVYDHVSPGEGCQFHRTEVGCGGSVEMTFQLIVSLSESTSADLNGVFDPFLFSAPQESRGGYFTNPPHRAYEVHLKNFSPTAAFDQNLFGRDDDASQPSVQRYYQNPNGMPWALEIPANWLYPQEYTDLLDAYPQFQGFVESAGENNQQWFLPENANLELVFEQN